MATGLKRPKSGRGSGVSGEGTADDTPKERFYAVPEKENDLLQIPLKEISPNPFNDDRDLGDLTQLADSIKRDGLVQEIAVMHTEVFAEHFPAAAAGIKTKYVLAFGERRWKAHEIAGKDEIASVLRNTVAPKIRRILFIENFHRKPLTPMEEARRFLRMHEEEGMSYQEIVDEVSLSGRNYVSRRLDLMRLPNALQQAIEAEELAITHARKLLQDLSTEEQRVGAFQLMKDEGTGVKEAIARVQSGESVPPGNSDGEVPTPRASSDTSGEAEEPKPSVQVGGEPPVRAQAADGQRAATPSRSPGKAKSSSKKHAPKSQEKGSTQDSDYESAERNRAANERAEACQSIISGETQLTAEQAAALFARCLLIPMQQGPARARALMWLREADRAEIAVTDTDSYFQAVLSSGRTDLINRVTLATALAAGEIRAKDGRRQWDATDTQHVQLLMEVGNYHPQTEWERGQLAKFKVSLPAADEAADLTH